jgi:hypothetical protein
MYEQTIAQPNAKAITKNFSDAAPRAYRTPAAEQTYRRRRSHQNIQAMTGLILQRLGYPTGKLRDFVDAVQAAHSGKAELLDPRAMFRRSHLTLAQFMQCKGETPESKRSTVSRYLDKHEKWQRKKGVILIEITRSTREGESTGYRDHLTAIADAAMQHALSDPAWKDDRDGRDRATAQAVEWAVLQFPTCDPPDDEPDAKENHPPPLGEYITQQRRRLIESADRVTVAIEDRGDTMTAIRFARELARDWARLADSMAKTQTARRMPVWMTPNAQGGEGEGGYIYANEFRGGDADEPMTEPTEPTAGDSDDGGEMWAQSLDFEPEYLDETDLDDTPPPVGNLPTPPAASSLPATPIFDPLHETPKSEAVKTAPTIEAEPDLAVLLDDGREALAAENFAVPPTPAERLAAALDYAGRGWRVVANYGITANGACECKRGAACKSAGKHPRLMGWQAEATTDRATIRRWWAKWPSSNVGLAMGAGLLAFDFDGEEGEALYRELRARGLLLDSLEQRTGGGGRQVIYVGAPDLPNEVRLVSGLDLRSQGGQIVVPPSFSGKGPYEWRRDREPAELSLPLLEWLQGKLLDLEEEKARTKPTPAPIDGSGPDDIIVREKGGSLPAVIRDGARNQWLFAYACGRRNSGLTRDELFEELRALNARCSPPLDDDELMKIATSAAKYAPAAA